MDRNTYIRFIKKLINQTKEKQIKWEYLDQNRQLCTSMNWVECTTIPKTIPKTIPEMLSGRIEHTYVFDVERSFYCTMNETNIVLYVMNGNPASIFVIPPTFKKIVVLSPDEYGDYITRLLNLVESQFLSADMFINDFLKDEE